MNPPPAGRRFEPQRLLRHAHVQSVLATKSPRRRLWRSRGSQMEAQAHYQLLDAGEGVRLCGWLSAQAGGHPARGSVVLIHGWEGSHDSVYLYSMACALHGAGYEVFRLNLRDHGDSFHLNEDVFHSARIDETVRAIASIPWQDREAPLSVVGFSLGGSFALRVARRGPELGLRPSLCVGISPLMQPASALHAIDHGPLVYRVYFMQKWRRSLRAKAAAWPQRWHFEEAELPRGSIYAATQRFAERYLPFGPVENYFQAYALTGQMLMDAAAPVAVIAAQDDPVTPFRDLAGLEAGGSVLAFEAPRRGGHCGFIENLGLETWSEHKVLEWLEQHAAHPRLAHPSTAA